MANLRETLALSVDELTLSTRIRWRFRDTGIKTIRDLVSKTNVDLLRLGNFGRISLAEVQEELAALNLHLAMDIEPEDDEPERFVALLNELHSG